MPLSQYLLLGIFNTHMRKRFAVGHMPAKQKKYFFKSILLINVQRIHIKGLMLLYLHRMFGRRRMFLLKNT
jgi:hypothetical protein